MACGLLVCILAQPPVQSKYNRCSPPSKKMGQQKQLFMRSSGLWEDGSTAVELGRGGWGGRAMWSRLDVVQRVGGIPLRATRAEWRTYSTSNTVHGGIRHSTSCYKSIVCVVWGLLYETSQVASVFACCFTRPRSFTFASVRILQSSRTIGRCRSVGR